MKNLLVEIAPTLDFGQWTLLAVGTGRDQLGLLGDGPVPEVVNKPETLGTPRLHDNQEAVVFRLRIEGLQNKHSFVRRLQLLEHVATVHDVELLRIQGL